MRLIDADRAKNSSDNKHDATNFFTDYRTIDDVRRFLDLQPTVEAEPTIHAHWVAMSDADGFYYCCSNCGEDLPRYYTERPTYDNPFPNMESIDKTPRCPYCGAIMDEVKLHKDCCSYLDESCNCRLENGQCNYQPLCDTGDCSMCVK